MNLRSVLARSSRRRFTSPCWNNHPRPTRHRGTIESLEERSVPAAALVADVNTATLDAGPRQTVNVGGTLYFAADDAGHGVELWKSDGTAAGTVLVKDIQPRARVANLDVVGLTNVRAEWTYRWTYGDRVSHLTGAPGGLNGDAVLTAATVTDDKAKDVLTGSAGTDWFVLGVLDRLDRKPGEAATMI